MILNTLISRIWIALACSVLAITQIHALDTGRADVQEFIGEMVTEHNFDRDSLTATLAGAETQQSILDAISRPAERVRQWHEYRQIFITPERIKAGVEFWNEHQETLHRISEDTGVPPEILVGIIGVETYFGRITGRYKVLDALVTLGFDYPPRSKFFRRELGEFLLLAREEELSVDETLGSYAGAMGSPQFIPSSYRAYAKDGDGNERRDLFQSWPDIIASVANYFVAHKWRKDGPVISRAYLSQNFSVMPPKRNRLKLDSTLGELDEAGLRVVSKLPASTPATFIALQGVDKNEYWAGFHNFYVITRYNRSVMYALAVWQLGQAISAEHRAQ